MSGLTLLLWNVLLDKIKIELTLILSTIVTSSGQKKRNDHLLWNRTCFVTDAVELFKHLQFLLSYDLLLQSSYILSGFVTLVGNIIERNTPSKKNFMLVEIVVGRINIKHFNLLPLKVEEALVKFMTIAIPYVLSFLD
jgi:hypothetical protein